MPSDRVRIDIAFEGGISLAVSVPQPTAEDLDRALANPDAESFSFEAEDGHYTVNGAQDRLREALRRASRSSASARSKHPASAEQAARSRGTPSEQPGASEPT